MMETGRNFDAVKVAVALGITIRFSDAAPDVGAWDADVREIALRAGHGPVATRSALIFQLGLALKSTPSAAVRWAAERVIPKRDLDALRSATSDRRLWARALYISPRLLNAYLALAPAAKFAA
ncbi:MAG TPA: hypothetical protein PKH61_02280 [Microbacteriaceae bacterium]|nr:hypothetical protein [Microbacteriaceae bacterium]HPZ34127.1 hypothetical protein [Microbacteriaceae bacterium]